MIPIGLVLVVVRLRIFTWVVNQVHPNFWELYDTENEFEFPSLHRNCSHFSNQLPCNLILQFIGNGWASCPESHGFDSFHRRLPFLPVYTQLAAILLKMMFLGVQGIKKVKD